MGFRVIAAMIVTLAGCGRLGFDPSDRTDDGDDTDVTDVDADDTDDTDVDDIDADDTDDTDDEPPADASPGRACHDNPLYTTIMPGTTTYRSVPALLSWADASALCEADEAHLAIPETMAEAVALGDNGDWVGITDTATEGTWITIFGAVPVYLMFQSGQPDGGASEDCLRVDGNGQFEDRECGDIRDSVCECPP